jgi:hypothetical protein
MDELDLLKSQWQTREHQFPVLSFNDIYKMLLKKSSSIVKWIFIISIGELLFWTILAFLVPESSKSFMTEMGMDTVFLIINIVNYTVFAFFIFLFWKNHKRIQVTDSVKELMENILKTRKTVKYFVIYNVSTAVSLMVGVNIFYYLNKEALAAAVQKSSLEYNAVPPEMFTKMFFIGQIVGGIIMVVFVLLFYFLVYGFLLKRLKRNYYELEKMEM